MSDLHFSTALELADKIKKKEITYYKYYNQKWKKVSKDECSNIEPNIKKIKKQKIVLSCNSVALIKLIK